MKIIGEELLNIPFEKRSENSNEPIWRFSSNPIINRYQTSVSNSIFNSAIVPFKDHFAGVFRVDNRAVQMNIYVGFSKDGINFDISDEPIKFIKASKSNDTESSYKYDPRVIKIGSRYYIVWCNGYHGPTIGMGYTDDFKTFYQLENAFLPYNRNGVLFPRKITDEYCLLSRPSDTGHTPFGDIFLSYSKDLTYWGKHRFVMGVSDFEDSAWQCLKIGAGPAPIETDVGWLLFYHGVIRSAGGYRYSMGCALLDIKDPSKVIARSKPYLLAPATTYEMCGDVPNVIFPCSALTDSKTGRIAIYYGAADTVVGLAFTEVNIVIPWLLKNNLNDKNKEEL